MAYFILISNKRYPKLTFFKISGTTLSIAADDTSQISAFEVVIGKTNRQETSAICNLSSDGFCIKTIDNKLFITGGNGKGVIYGVTSLLEDYLGCRKLSPAVEYVPQRSSIVLPDIDEGQVQQMKNFTFRPGKARVRYIKFQVTATKMLPAWHDYTGNKSWVFIDEIVVR